MTTPTCWQLFRMVGLLYGIIQVQCMLTRISYQKHCWKKIQGSKFMEVNIFIELHTCTDTKKVNCPVYTVLSCVRYWELYQSNKQKTYLGEITALPGVILFFGKGIVHNAGLSCSCYVKNCNAFSEWFINLIVLFSDFGKNPQIVSFLENHCTMRRADGSLCSTMWVQRIVLYKTCKYIPS